MRVSHAFAIAFVGTSVACSSTQIPTAPAELVAEKTANLTVRVLTRGTEQPIAGATVSKNGAVVGATNGLGEMRTPVPVGTDFQIDVAAPGLVGFGVGGTVRSDERWTFYLEPIE